MDKDKQADDIINMIDSFMQNGGGHMNVTVKDDGSVSLDKQVKVTNSLECAEGNMACSVPTLFKGMDNEAYDE